jgi:DNA-directed RNA polymerase specialized sigma24 family protein
MAEENAFLQLIEQVRAGDEAAASEVVRRFEQALLREIRLRLRDPRLRRALDSVDICQSVMASFFLRAASGQYQLETSSQLLRLLVAMARNKLASQARHSYVTRRDPDALRGGLTGGETLYAPGPEPAQVVAARDFCGALLSRLSDEERQLADRRARSEGWAAIAAELGGNPENLRKKLARALERAARCLGEDTSTRE